MSSIENTFAHTVGDHWRTEFFRKFPQRRGQILCSATDENQRACRAREQRGRPFDGILVKRDERIVMTDHRVSDGSFPRKDIHRYFKADRPWPARAERAERCGDVRRSVFRAVDTLRPFGEPFENSKLIGELVQIAKPLADGVTGNLTGQAKHVSAGAIGGPECTRRVQQSGSGYHGKGCRLAGSERGSERHVRRTLFVTSMYNVDLVASVEQRIKERIVLDTGQAVERLQAVVEQRSHHRVRSGFHRNFGTIETVCHEFYSPGASNRFSKVPMLRDVAASRM